MKFNTLIMPPYNFLFQKYLDISNICNYYLRTLLQLERNVSHPIILIYLHDASVSYLFADIRCSLFTLKLVFLFLFFLKVSIQNLAHLISSHRKSISCIHKHNEWAI